jgi:hypothetical protein
VNLASGQYFRKLFRGKRECEGFPRLHLRLAWSFVERDLIAGAIVELGGARTFVRGHRLGVLQRAAGFKKGDDARRKVWQPILTRVPRSAARRWIMRQASTWFIGLSVSVPVRPMAERKRGALPASRMPAASAIR